MRSSSFFGRLKVSHVFPVLPIALFVVAAATPIRDNSFLWHVRAGSLQLESLRVLTTDPFSYTRGGEAWRTQSWLAELLYAQIEALVGGVAWASTLVGIVGAGVLGIIGLSVYRRAGSAIATTIWLLPAAWLLVSFNQPRPVIFSYLLLSMLVLTLDLEGQVGWAIVPIIWVWSGIHGSWFIGLGLVTLVAISRRSKRLAVLAMIGTFMTIATPHGLATWGILLSFARNSAALEYMQEWGVPDFVSVLLAPFLLILVGILVAAISGKVTMSDLWIILPFAMLGFTSRRAVPVAAIVLLPFAARSIAVALPTGKRESAAVPWILLIVIIAGTVLGATRTYDVFRADLFPSDAAIAAAGTGHYFHDDIVGGYLIYREGPNTAVYIDDRAELYGAPFLAEFTAALEGDYLELFERFNLTRAIVRADWPLRGRLLGDGWRVVHADGAFEVLAPAQTSG